MAFILFACASIRHLLFQSNALDLGWFDQTIYLISQGQPPIVSFQNFHILGDHAAGIVYPLAGFYKLFPSTYWLLLLQAIALAVGGIATGQLAQQVGLSPRQSLTFAGIYWLYPLVFNVNLFDFHPEVFALPGLLWAIWAARGKRWGLYGLTLVVILSSKAVLSLTVAMMGVWLLFWEKRRGMGIVALIAGTAWFVIATKGIIPLFSGQEAAAVNRYAFLGDSVGEIALNLIRQPQVVLQRLFTGMNATYLLLLVAPVAWGLWGRSWSVLIPALPMLLLNLLTDYYPQKDLVHQYSLPMLPFLLLLVMQHWHQGSTWLKRPHWILLWSLVAFLALGKYTYFFGPYWQHWSDLDALQQGITAVPADDRVLTAPHLAAHLSHRPTLRLAIRDEAPFDLQQFDSVLLQRNHAGWADSQETVQQLIQQLEARPDFTITFEQDPIILFQRQVDPSPR